MTVKMMDLGEFVRGGFLQEANRLFFHPLGLALELTCDGGQARVSGIWDYREDPEGIAFGDPPDVAKAQAVEEERHRHEAPRMALFGQSIQQPGQPLPNSGGETRGDR